jgi:hypothetical protein
VGTSNRERNEVGIFADFLGTDGARPVLLSAELLDGSFSVDALFKVNSVGVLGDHSGLTALVGEINQGSRDRGDQSGGGDEFGEVHD